MISRSVDGGGRMVDLNQHRAAAAAAAGVAALPDVGGPRNRRPITAAVRVILRGI
jgi:hypothetical protein